jgi:hypothetical protein
MRIFSEPDGVGDAIGKRRADAIHDRTFETSAVMAYGAKWMQEFDISVTNIHESFHLVSLLL